MPFVLFGENSKPDFINEKGTKWWRITDFDKKTKQFDGAAYYIELIDGTRQYILTDGKEVIYETASYEALACWIQVIISNIKGE